MLRFIFAITFFLLSAAAFADWERTCNAVSFMSQCEETFANYGEPQMCAVGLQSAGRNCPRVDDFGMCRMTNNSSGYITMVDIFYYEGNMACTTGESREECIDRLAVTCVNFGSRQWFPPEST